jgi:hypothetical protein
MSKLTDWGMLAKEKSYFGIEKDYCESEEVKETLFDGFGEDIKNLKAWRKISLLQV